MEANGSGSGSSSDSAPDCWDQADIEPGSGAGAGSAPPAAEAEAQQELLGAAFSRQLNVNAKPFVPNVHAAEFVPSFLRGGPAPGLPPPSPPPGLPPPPHGTCRAGPGLRRRWALGPEGRGPCWEGAGPRGGGGASGGRAGEPGRVRLPGRGRGGSAGAGPEARVARPGRPGPGSARQHGPAGEGRGGGTAGRGVGGPGGSAAWAEQPWAVPPRGSQAAGGRAGVRGAREQRGPLRPLPMAQPAGLLLPAAPGSLPEMFAGNECSVAGESSTASAARGSGVSSVSS